jgi:cyclic pyranopterin phosphate synthase
MTPEEIERILRIGLRVGIRKLKITGGEPLLRDDILDITTRASRLVKEVSLTTNGSHLAHLALPLKESGLKRVNVSLHTLDPLLYTSLCGVDLSARVASGIRAAVRAGLNPVKVNMVVLKGENEKEIESMMEFCGRAGAVLQLIEYAANKERENGVHFRKRFYPLKDIEERLSRIAVETSMNELHRRRRFSVRVNGTAVSVEVVRPMHNTEFCSNCTRIRMSSDGHLKPCLLDPGGTIDVLTPMRNGAPDDEIHELFLKAIRSRRPYWS